MAHVECCSIVQRSVVCTMVNMLYVYSGCGLSLLSTVKGFGNQLWSLLFSLLFVSSWYVGSLILCVSLSLILFPLSNSVVFIACTLAI